MMTNSEKMDLRSMDIKVNGRPDHLPLICYPQRGQRKQACRGRTIYKEAGEEVCLRTSATKGRQTAKKTKRA